MAQRLGRIRQARSGWGPKVTLSARTPPRVALAIGGTVALLDRAIYASRVSARTQLQAWLAQQVVRVDGELEHMSIRAVGTSMTRDNVQEHIPELTHEALRVLNDLEQGTQFGQ
jgi:lysozyme family protein